MKPFSIAGLKDMAKEKMTGRYGNAIMLLLFWCLITLFVNNTSSALNQYFAVTLCRIFSLTQANLPISLISYIPVVFFSVLIEVFQVGMCLFFLNAACGNQNLPGNLFYGFRENAECTIRLAAVQVLLSLICFLPTEIIQYLRSLKDLTDSTFTILITIQVILFVIYLYLTLCLSQCYYLLLDYPEQDAKSILSLSIKVMKGNKWKLFCLNLSFLPLLLLCIPTFGIAILWVMPYIQTSKALFFLEIMKKND